MNNCCNCDEKKAGCPWQVALWILAVLGVIVSALRIIWMISIWTIWMMKIKLRKP